MNIEQRYNKLINAIKVLQETNPSNEGIQNWVNDNVPELAESEGERIRRVIRGWIYTRPASFFDNGISKEEILAWLERQGEHLENFDEAEKEKSDFVGDGFIKCYADFQDFKEGETYWFEYIGDDKYNVRSDNLLGKTYHITPCQLYTVFKKLTWLEKQGEQRPVDKAEPKFHPGDWVVENGVNGNPVQITSFEEDKGVGIKVWFSNGTGTYVDFLRGYHKWTIRDARDGDVIVCDINKAEIGGDVEKLPNITPTICIYQTVVKDKDYIHSYCSLYDGSFLVPQNRIYYNAFVYNIQPATKEQRDSLFRKIKEAGYEWNAEQKVLKKLGQVGNCTWSNEDERVRKALKQGFLEYGNSFTTFHGIKVEDITTWLEKQKPIDEEEFKRGALKYVALQFMNWLDKEIPEDEMCLSNAECKVIEDAFLKRDWTSISRYMQEKLGKQNEQPDDNKLKFQKIKEEGYKYEQSIFMHHQERCRSNNPSD